MGVHALWGSLGFANGHKALESLRHSRTEAGVLNPFSIQNQIRMPGGPDQREVDHPISSSPLQAEQSLHTHCSVLDGREAVWSTVAQGSL